MADALPIVYVNGIYQPKAEARISPFDRGFLFADAVYEVIPVFRSKAVLLDNHLIRLDNSLQELRIRNPHSKAEWISIIDTLILKNGGGDIGIYLQVSRGAEEGRDHFYPPNITPTVFAMATPIVASPKDTSGISVITLEDNRWLRCDIKSTSLLANIMVRQQARDAGADDAILIKDGVLTEAGSASVLTVESDTVITRPNSNQLLPGTTRAMVLELAAKAGIKCQDEIISEERLLAADEICLLSATKGIVPVIQIDGKAVGGGTPGPVWAKLYALYEDAKKR
ncbi:MAG: D-amino acid aminotransferase [Chromatiales bacterium]|nr:D-amino acid aminotransferase [Chromatiales bacterium]